MPTWGTGCLMERSFYYMDTTLEDRPVWSRLALTAEVIKAELSAHVGDYKDNVFSWEVTETAPMVFSVPFP